MSLVNDRLRDSLQHIVRVCIASRTRTKRIKWIEEIAQAALDERPVNNTLAQTKGRKGAEIRRMPQTVEELG